MQIGRFVITHPAAIGAAVAAAWAVAAGIYGLANHSGTLTVSAVTALIAAIGALGIRQAVTPVARPRDNQGRQLVPVVQKAPAARKGAA